MERQYSIRLARLGEVRIILLNASVLSYSVLEFVSTYKYAYSLLIYVARHACASSLECCSTSPQGFPHLLKRLHAVEDALCHHQLAFASYGGHLRLDGTGLPAR